MIIKSTKEFIFTKNKTLKNVNFDKKVIINKPTKWLYPFYSYSLGKFEFECDDEIDEIRLTYQPSTINKLKYLYRVDKIGPALEFKYMCYAKLSIIQHIKVQYSNKLLIWLSKPQNIFNISTLIIAIATLAIGLKQIKLSDKIQKIEIVNYEKELK